MRFETYVRQHAQALARLATVLTDDAATAEDVVQDVLLRAHGRWAVIAAADHPHAYVRRMIVNEATSWRRKWSRVEPRADGALDRPARDDISVLDARDELVRAVANLPSRQRAAVVLRFFEDLDDAEIADILGCKAVTVRGYVHRAMTTLRVEFTPESSRPVVACERTTP